MDSAMYDQVSRLSLDGKPTGSGAQRFRKGVRAVIAHQRLDTQIYGRRWNDLTPEGQQHIVDERRERRLRESEERRKAEAARVSYADLTTTLRRNSVLSAASLPSARRMSTAGAATDLRRLSSNLVWTKAWHLSEDASKPILDSSAQYHNRSGSAAFVTREHLLNLGVVYIKLPTLTADLAALNELCVERGYCQSTTEELNPKQTARITKWYMEHYYTAESMHFASKGSCYIDVRDEHGDFIRIHLSEGDLVVIPAGLYHRGALDQSQNLKLMRLFQDEDFSECFRDDPRAQQHDSRALYLTSLKRRSVCEDNSFIRD